MSSTFVFTVITNDENNCTKYLVIIYIFLSLYGQVLNLKGKARQLGLGRGTLVFHT